LLPTAGHSERSSLIENIEAYVAARDSRHSSDRYRWRASLPGAWAQEGGIRFRAGLPVSLKVGFSAMPPVRGADRQAGWLRIALLRTGPRRPVPAIRYALPARLARTSPDPPFTVSARIASNGLRRSSTPVRSAGRPWLPAYPRRSRPCMSSTGTFLARVGTFAVYRRLGRPRRAGIEPVELIAGADFGGRSELGLRTAWVDLLPRRVLLRADDLPPWWTRRIARPGGVLWTWSTPLRAGRQLTRRVQRPGLSLATPRARGRRASTLDGLEQRGVREFLHRDALTGSTSTTLTPPPSTRPPISPRRLTHLLFIAELVLSRVRASVPPSLLVR